MKKAKKTNKKTNKRREKEVDEEKDKEEALIFLGKLLSRTGSGSVRDNNFPKKFRESLAQLLTQPRTQSLAQSLAPWRVNIKDKLLQPSES